MPAFPATTVKVTAIEPMNDAQVRIRMEMIVDVHRLAEVGSELLRSAITQIKAERAGPKKKK